MAKISKYLQISPKLLLEYIYDTGAEDFEKFTGSLVRDLSGTLTFVNSLTQYNTEQLENYFTAGLMNCSWPNQQQDEYFYPGFISVTSVNEDYVQTNMLRQLYAKQKIADVLMSNQEFTLPADEIKIHISTGYVFDDCEGFLLKIWTNQYNKTDVKNYLSTDNKVVLQNFTFHKENLAKCVKFSHEPLYMTQKFYDRYISIKIPSIYYMGSRKINYDILTALNIDTQATANFSFDIIETEDFDKVDNGIIADDPTLKLYNQGIFSIREFTEAEIVFNSIADNFNVRMYEDTENNCIRYYPMWNNKLMTQSIMDAIEYGTIQMNKRGFFETSDEDIDQFEQLYGSDARKWVIVNQLELSCHYDYILAYDTDNQNSVMKSYKLSQTIDYQDNDIQDNEQESDLYTYAYRPIVTSISGMYCRFINIRYTSRLVNRLNGEEVVRIASMRVDNAESKYGLNSLRLNVDNIYTWKIFNKKEITEVQTATNNNLLSSTKYITRYYSNDSVVALNDDNSVSSQGEYILYLFESDHIYKLTLYSDKDKKIPLAMSGNNATYMLRYYDDSGNAQYIMPTYSKNMSMSLGELEFSISASLVKVILSGNKNFAIVANTINGISTVFAGKFDSVYNKPIA